ncbi:MAG TPA: sugar phosphate nucleotidyltransferase [Bryobacteraceae bacterium]|nr:sugar phosphate nucleotidyltransferase [Bryobacteraceae bacterium]
MPKRNYYAMIMAGGRGTRFWPRSRRRHAKQVLSVSGPRTLIQETFDRLRPFLPPERMWVVTNEYLRDEIVRQLPEVPKRQILAEPAQRNTAPCNALAAHILASIDRDAVIGVFPADHIVGRPARYRRLLAPAYRAADQGKLVVLGIEPRWPETGYGYLEFPKGTKAGGLEPVRVIRFREKPDAAAARRYLKAGNYYWNAGVFFWRADVFLEAVRRYMPKTATLLAAVPPFLSRNFAGVLAKTYPLCENISVDYAIMEKADNVVGLPAGGDLEWNDVGSWNAVYELLAHDADGNAARAAEILSRASARNYVDAEGKLVALLGVEDLIVVDTKDALLVGTRARAQEVGAIVKELERRKRDDLL